MLVLWQFLAEWLQQPKRAGGLLLAQMSDKLLQLLLRGHPSSVSTASMLTAKSAAVMTIARESPDRGRPPAHGEDFLYKLIKGAPPARQAAGRTRVETWAEDAKCRRVGA